MRVAIVNDMLTAVECLRRSVLHGGHDIAWVARDGKEAVAHCVADRPDLILMDLYMPVMDGVEATRQIMVQAPCPIVVVTSSVDDHAARAFEAMGAGALDAVNTPVCGLEGDMNGASDLLNKIATIQKLVAHTEVESEAEELEHPKQFNQNAVPMVVIGSSSGGPQALVEVLKEFPPDFRAAVVIVQHVDAHFAGELAAWLDQYCCLNVRTAREGDKPAVGEVLIARTNDHLKLTKQGNLIYAEEPKDMVYRPSVDVFFESVVKYWNGPVMGCLLTGMGNDGALGLLELKKNGVFTMAQNEESCAVFGMPKAAIELNAAVQVGSLEVIAREMNLWQVSIASECNSGDYV